MFAANPQLQQQPWYPTNPGFITVIGGDIDQFLGVGPRALTTGIQSGQQELGQEFQDVGTKGGQLLLNVGSTVGQAVGTALEPVLLVLGLVAVIVLVKAVE